MTARLQKIFLLLFFFANAHAVDRDLPYPAADAAITGAQLAEQVYFVNHLYAFETVEIDAKKNRQLQIINYIPGKKPTRLLARRYVNHRIEQENVKTRDMVIFTSGKQKGMGVLVTDYLEAGKPMSVSIWLPVLRKVRRITEPEHDEIWAGSILTYGDIYLRRPEEETHQILDEEQMDSCLETIVYQASDLPYKEIPQQDCDVRGRQVYLLKSSHNKDNWWYDYRLRWVDKSSFADYRTHYFKDGKRIKIMTKSWHQLDPEKPRAIILKYWFARSEINNQQSLAVVPLESVKTDTGRKDNFWSEATLRRIRR